MMSVLDIFRRWHGGVMELRLKLGADSIRNKCILAFVVLLCGALAAYTAQLGILLAPFVAAPLSALFLLERGKPKVLSLALPICLLALDAVFNGIYSYSAIAAIVIALSVYLALGLRIFAKADAAMLAVVLVSAIAFLTIILYGCRLNNTLSFAASFDYYRNLVEQMRGEWLSVISNYLAQSAASGNTVTLTNEDILALYDNYVLSLYSVVIIAAFTLVGISYKLFTAIFARFVEKKVVIYKWRFALSPIYAIAYLILYVLQLFAAGYSAFAVVTVNLMNVMMVLFAYLGLLFADAYFRMKSDGRSGGKLIVLIAVLFIGSTALVLLSLLGVFASFAANKAEKSTINQNNNDGGSDAGQK